MTPIKQHIKMKISILSCFILSFISHTCFSQIFDSEQNPLSVKWRQINNGGFKIIYPTELEKDAQRMANTIGFIYPYVGASLNRQKTTIPIVFQNRGMLANGFVQLAPKKSQFNTTPPQQFDSQDWLNNLAVHELRHVAQFDKITNGKSLFLSEEIYFAYMGITIPTWFFEGDAVSTETSLTNAGRGRQPSWIMPFRTSLLNGQKFSYSKAYFGSAKDQTPGYYQLGYLLTSNLRASFGKNIVDSLITEIRNHPLRFYPFSQTLKKITGFNTNAYYKNTIEKLQRDWQAQDQQNQSENYKSLNKAAKYVTNYYLPTEIAPNQILTLKQSKSTPPAFVVIDADGREKKLTEIAYQEQAWYSYANNLLVWDEIRFDPRYKQRSYSVICSYDLITKKRKQLTFKSRLFSPTLSGDGKKLIAVQIDLSNKCNLVAIDPQTGNIIQTYPNPTNLILQTPALNQDGSQLTYVSVSEKGKALWLLTQDGKTEQLIPESNQQLGRPVFINDQIAFNAHLSGVNNIYNVSLASKKITALTAAKYGAFNVSLSLDQKSIFFNNFQLTGYDVAKSPLVEKEVQADHFVYFGAAAEKQEHTGNVFEKVPDSIFESKPYRPMANLFNFHSISPNIDENDRPGLRIKSNDLLNNLDLYAGFSYNNDLRKMEYNAGFNFKSLYPIFSITYKNRPRSSFYKVKEDIKQANWRENYIDLKASLPLSVNAYNNNFSLFAEVNTSYTIRNFNTTEASLFSRTIKFPMNYQLVLGHSLRTAERDIAPKFAQTISLSYFNLPFDQNRKGQLFAFGSYFYFPGLAKNHSFMASFNYRKASGTFTTNNEITTVYGYNQIKAKSELKNTFLLNYRFPIAFPDAEIGSLAYIRNIRGGIFSHYENIGHETNLTQPKTYGFELRSSLNLLRYQPVVDLGARVIFVNKTYNQNPILEFIFNYSF
ncbi:hypothetical protein AQF98_05900 [Pedobacter sp. Hv1]|nr:hypothetical protein AQF98_05900 [Pedobacter sp. Hv1]